MVFSRAVMVVMQLVPITTNVVSSNPAHGDTTLCEKVCQWLAVDGFPRGTPVSSTNKTDYHDITEILFESGAKHNDPTLALSLKNKYSVDSLTGTDLTIARLEIIKLMVH